MISFRNSAALVVFALILSSFHMGFAANTSSNTKSKKPTRTVYHTTCGKPLRGIASYYGKNDGYAGKRTASGEILSSHKMTAAHPTLPFGTLVRVRSRTTKREVTVRINDRGPFVKGRMIDLNYAAARTIGLDRTGVGKVDMRICRR